MKPLSMALIIGLIFLGSHHTSAQTIIDSSSVSPLPGEQFIVIGCESFGGDTTTGTNLIWDYSTSFVEEAIDTVICEPIDSNLVTIGGIGKFGDVQLTHSDNEIVEVIGLFSSSLNIEAYKSGNYVVGSGGISLISLPVLLESTDTAYFNYYPTGEPWFIEGARYLHVNGHGTLHLPSGTFSDTYRICIIKDGNLVFTDTWPYQVIPHTDTMNIWLKAGIHYPLLITHTDHWINDFGSYDVQYLMSVLPVHTYEYTDNLNYTIYPNPSTGNFQVDLGTIDYAIIKMFDMQGTLINQLNVNGQNKVILDKPPVSGTYIVQLTTNQGISHSQLIHTLNMQ